MDVTVYTVELLLDGTWETQHFVSDGEGPDIELSSASVAGAVAHCLGVRKGCRIASEVADMWIRHGAVERYFTEADEKEELDHNHRVQALVEQASDEQPSEALLFVGLDNAGVARTAATEHRIDAVREFQAYMARYKR